MNCEDCGEAMREGALRCRCGWVVKESRKPPPLQYAGKTIQQLNVEAARYCRQHGLDTIEKMRAFVLENVRKIGRKAA